MILASAVVDCWEAPASRFAALSLGTATFGGSNDFFKGFGETEVEEARRMVNICFEASVNLFDTADGYWEGRWGDFRQGSRGQARPGVDFDQVGVWNRTEADG